MLECPPCGKKFTGNESLEQHLQSDKHKKRMSNVAVSQIDSTFDSESTIPPSPKNDKELKCVICDLSFDSLEVFQIHALSQEHALKIIQGTQLNQEKSSLISPSSAINNHELNDTRCKVGSTTESVLPELNGGRFYESCSACSKTFSGLEPYKQHIESKAHQKKIALQTITENNGGNLDLMKCETCNKSFSGIVPYDQHMSSDVHKKKLQNILAEKQFLSNIGSSNSQAMENGFGGKVHNIKLWFCNVCKVECSGQAPYEQHMNGSTHFKNEKRIEIQKKFEKANIVASGMQVNIPNENKISVKPENIAQFVNSYQKKDEENQNNFEKRDIDMASAIKFANLNGNSLSEKSENISQSTNGNYQNCNGEKQNDFGLKEENYKIEVTSADELAKLVKVVLPDDKITFDESDSVETLLKM